MEILATKLFAVVSLRGYAMGGGGEMFLYQTLQYAKKFGMTCVWLSFTSNTLVPYPKTKIEFKEDIWFINIGEGFNESVLDLWLKLLNPYVIHHQGHMRLEICRCASKLNIPILTGYHFWSGAVDLFPETYNKNIMENIKHHKPSKELDQVSSLKNVTQYVCSEFLKDVICKVTTEEVKESRKYTVIHPSSLQCFKKTNTGIKKRFVTCCNIHKLKGGEIFKYLIQNLSDIPFLGIISESHSENLDREIIEIAEVRNSNPRNSKVVILNHTEDMASIYAKTKILLIPSQVDETFCRVANEGLMNGLPIITTGCGNIKYMVGDAAIILPSTDNFSSWSEEVRKLYFSKERIEHISLKAKTQYLKFSEAKCFKTFKKTILEMVKHSKYYNLCFLVPWCDQGLGIQTKNYVNTLKDDFRISIFSFKPYIISDVKGTARDFQNDPKEWIIDGVNVYYSTNTREMILDSEIIDFVLKNNIGKVIIPETCWSRIFEISKLLKRLGVVVYAIPNIEIVRKDELYKHEVFDYILCNNDLCKTLFAQNDFTNTRYIGYSIPLENTKTRNGNIENILTERTREAVPIERTREVASSLERESALTFLNIGGLNAFTRKQTMEVCEAFEILVLENPGINARLIVTVQENINDNIRRFSLIPGVILILKHLSNEQIQELYQMSHVNIQVSKHEGLGLGFYESLSYGVPVLTLNTPPHNEIIKDTVNGWLLDCSHVQMTDNNDSLLQSAVFNVKNLTDMMKKICEKYENGILISKKTVLEDFKERFSFKSFQRNLKEILS